MNNSTEFTSATAARPEQNLEYKFQYACNYCSQCFVTAKLCNEHVGICSTQNTSPPKVNILENKLLLKHCEASNVNIIDNLTNFNKLNDQFEVLNTKQDTELNNSELYDINAQDILNGNRDALPSSNNISNIKVLAVLNPVERNQLKLFEGECVKDSEDSCESEQIAERTETVSETAEDLIFCDAFTEESSCENSLQTNEDNDKESTSIYNQQSDDCISFNLDQKWYKKINEPKIIEPEAVISVYDFYDEEEEKANMEKLEKEKKAKDLKQRTCRFCNETFDDPIEVLRHKRKKHNFSKIYMSKEELAPYLEMKLCDSCPICQKPFGKKIYKSQFHSHLMTHCNTQVYECGICGAQFKRKDHQKNHESRHIVNRDLKLAS